MRHSRFSDYSVEETDRGDFVIRKRIPPLWQLGGLFVAGLLGIVCLAWFSNQWEQNIIFIALAAGILLMLAWYTLFFTQQNRDLLLATEFQNALFAASTALHTRFTLITKQDGSIIYYDPGFQELFPEFLRMEQRAIDVLLRAGRATDADLERITQSLRNGVFEKFILNLTLEDGRIRRMMLSIDPLPRPRGFFLFRGREYVEQRAITPSIGGSFKPTADAGVPAALSYLMHDMPVGAYVLDHRGEFQFINHTLESWLGYTPGEILTRKISLPQLIDPGSGARGGAVEISAFEGGVSFQCKDGRVLHAQVKQQVQFEKGPHMATATGIVWVEGEDTPAKKK